MPAREINPITALTRIRSVSQDTMIDEQSSASVHDYASDHSAIGAGLTFSVRVCIVSWELMLHGLTFSVWKYVLYSGN